MNPTARIFSSIFTFLLGVFAVFYFKGCWNDDQKPDTIIKKVRVIDTQYVKIKNTKYVKGDTIVKDTTIFVPITELVDTLEILKGYHAKNVFVDTFKTDYGDLLIRDTIQFNKIKGRVYKSDISIPVVTINDTFYVASKYVKPALFWGLSGDFANGRLIGSSANLFLETKKRRIYGAGMGVMNGKPVYRATVMIKF